MQRCVAIIAAALAFGAFSQAAPAEATVYDYSVPSADGQRSVPLAQYRGKATLIVNIGTRSQYAAQLTGLEALQERFAKAGFSVLAVPSADFGDLTPGSGSEIEALCRTTYHATFPVFGRISVRGDDQLPLYRYLTDETAPEVKGEVHWLFTKFLVDRQGKVLKRFEPGVAPDDPALVSAIEQVIAGTLKKEKDKKEDEKPAADDDRRRV